MPFVEIKQSNRIIIFSYLRFFRCSSNYHKSNFKKININQADCKTIETVVYKRKVFKTAELLATSETSLKKLKNNYLPVIPTNVSKSSVKAANVTGGAIASIGKNSRVKSDVSSSRPKSVFKLLRNVTVIMGNELDRVSTGNRAKK